MFLIFSWTSNFNLLQFCSPLSNADAQYLIWKSSQFLNWIVKNIAALLRSDISIQSIPIYVVSAYVIGTPYSFSETVVFVAQTFIFQFSKFRKKWEKTQIAF